MKIDPFKTSHLIFFILLLPILSIITSYLLNLAIQSFLVENNVGWYFLIDSFGLFGSYIFFYRVFDKHLWKYLPFKLFGIVSVPNIEGRWKGKILSSWNGRTTPYKASLEIKQTFSNVKICMYMERSHSYSLISDFIEDETGQLSLRYEYRNEPNEKAERTMNIHIGAGNMVLHSNTKTIEGEYYNSPRYGRGNSGDYKFKFVQKKLLHHI